MTEQATPAYQVPVWGPRDHLSSWFARANHVKLADGESTMDCVLEIDGEEKPALVLSVPGMPVGSG